MTDAEARVQAGGAVDHPAVLRYGMASWPVRVSEVEVVSGPLLSVSFRVVSDGPPVMGPAAAAERMPTPACGYPHSHPSHDFTRPDEGRDGHFGPRQWCDGVRGDWQAAGGLGGPLLLGAQAASDAGAWTVHVGAAPGSKAAYFTDAQHYDTACDARPHCTIVNHHDLSS